MEQQEQASNIHLIQVPEPISEIRYRGNNAQQANVVDDLNVDNNNQEFPDPEDDDEIQSTNECIIHSDKEEGELSEGESSEGDYEEPYKNDKESTLFRWTPFIINVYIGTMVGILLAKPFVTMVSAFL